MPDVKYSTISHAKFIEKTAKMNLAPPKKSIPKSIKTNSSPPNTKSFGFNDKKISSGPEYGFDASQDIKINSTSGQSLPGKQSFISTALDSAGKAGSNFVETIKDTGNKILSGSANDLNKVGNVFLNDYSNKYADIAGKFTGNIDNKISKLTGGLLNTNIGGFGKGVTKDFINKVGKGAVSNLAKGAGGALNDLAAGDISGAIGSLTGGVTGALGSAVKDSVSFISEDLPDKIREALFGKKEKVYERPEIIPLPRIIGLPPLPKEFVVSNDIFKMTDEQRKAINLEAEMTKDTFPILEIIPCKGVSNILSGSLDLYKVISCWNTKDESIGKSYVDYMQDFYRVNVGRDRGKLYVAVLNEAPITETFTNDFRDSIFENIAQGASQGWIRDIAQIMNWHSLGNIESSLGLKGKEIKGPGGVTLGKSSWSGEMMNKALNAMGVSPNASVYNGLKQMASVAVQSALGHGLDFPQIWATSGYSPNYSFTVRLYNPYPGDPIAIDKYLIGPLTVLMSFVVPRSIDGYQYFQPWLCKIRMKGLIPLTPCYVSNISIVKGGDHNNIGWNQKAGIVDVKIDFKILYKVMVATNKAKKVQVPQFHHWLEEFVENRGYNANKDKDQIKPLWYRTPLQPESLLSKLLNALGLGELNKYFKGTALEKSIDQLASRTSNIAKQFAKTTVDAGLSSFSKGVKLAYNGIQDAAIDVALTTGYAEKTNDKVAGSPIPPKIPPMPSTPPTYNNMNSMVA